MILLVPPRRRHVTHAAVMLLVRWVVRLIVGIAITLALAAALQVVFAAAHVA